VQARLLNLARARKEHLQLVLLRYLNERLLYRLASSRQRSKFVLKGAALFTLWTGAPHRATRDLDLGSSVDDSAETIREALIEVLSTEVVDATVLPRPRGAGRDRPVRDGVVRLSRIDVSRRRLL